MLYYSIRRVSLSFLFFLSSVVSSPNVNLHDLVFRAESNRKVFATVRMGWIVTAIFY